ncbi:MAG: STAS domain-containing protein [Spirochaetales bacterium]|nr:STAS domain-containing protein [Spirochaetales bacterium]
MQYTLQEESLSAERSLIHLAGRLTAANAGAVKKELLDIVAQGKKELIFDLSGVSFMDSSGLSVFVSLLRATGERKGWIKLAALKELPAEVFRLTLLDRIIDLYTDVESALRTADSNTRTF